MPRKFEYINPEVLTVEKTGRRSHCKVCGEALEPGTWKLSLNHNGTRLSFCIKCVLARASILMKHFDVKCLKLKEVA